VTAVRVITRRATLRLVLAAAAISIAPTRAKAGPVLTGPVLTDTVLAVWHDPGCLCCEGWIRHVKRAGFSVTVHATDDMAGVKQANGVPEAMQSCHTAVIDGYVIEGHVPAADIARLLADRPAAKGLAVPGMPASAPGMDQPGEPYVVMLFGTPTGDRVFARH
jgi:hypothetical protein